MNVAVTAADADGVPTITFRRLETVDFPLLARWLATPRVRRWWCHDTDLAAVERDFGPGTRGQEPGEDLLVFFDRRPVGLVQRQRWADYPDYLAEVAPLHEVPSEALTIDYLIGEPELLGRGLGPRMLVAVVADCWQRYPKAPCLVVPVHADNRASWRALEIAGFTRVAEGELEPDNPADDRRHVLYRLDRPSAR